MERLLKQNEIEKLQSTFRAHPILSTCYKLFTPRMARLNSLQVSQEDIFCETARLLDFMLWTPEISQHQVDSLWTKMLLDIRKWKADATDHDKRIVANTVFHIVRATLTQHTESRYRDRACDLLTQTIEHNHDGLDEKEYNEFLQRLIEKSPELCEWINQYDEENEWLSDRIDEIISSNEDEKKTPHHIEQPILTFTSKYDGKKLLTVYNRLKDDYVTCSEDTWLYLWGVFVHPVKKVTIDRPEKPAVWSAMRGKKSALMEMVRALMAADCGEILKKTAKWFVFSDGTIPDPGLLKSYELKGKTKTEFLQLVTVH